MPYTGRRPVALRAQGPGATTLAQSTWGGRQQRVAHRRPCRRGGRSHMQVGEEGVHGGEFLVKYLEEKQISPYRWAWEGRRKVYFKYFKYFQQKCVWEQLSSCRQGIGFWGGWLSWISVHRPFHSQMTGGKRAGRGSALG